MLNGLKEYMKYIGNLGREIETIKENKLEVLELKSTIYKNFQKITG